MLKLLQFANNGLLCLYSHFLKRNAAILKKTLEAINNKIWPEMFNKIHFKDFMHKWRASFALSMFNWINQGRNGGHIWHYEHSNYYLLCMRFSRISRMSSESEEIWSWATRRHDTPFYIIIINKWPSRLGAITHTTLK